MGLLEDTRDYVEHLAANGPATASALARAHGHSLDAAKRRVALARRAGLVVAGPNGYRVSGPARAAGLGSDR